MTRKFTFSLHFFLNILIPYIHSSITFSALRATSSGLSFVGKQEVSLIQFTTRTTYLSKSNQNKVQVQVVRSHFTKLSYYFRPLKRALPSAETTCPPIPSLNPVWITLPPLSKTRVPVKAFLCCAASLGFALLSMERILKRLPSKWT